MRSLFAVAALILVTANARAQSEPAPPGGIADEPSGKPAKPLDASAPTEMGTHQLGVRARYIFVTKAMLSPYLNADTGTQMNSYSVGLEYVYRKPGKSYDVVTSLDFSWLAVDDGNYLGSGHDPSLDTHYTQFRNLSFISADVSIIGWHKFLPWLELRYGAGLGLGLVPGDVLITNNGPQCTAANARDPSQCYPTSPGQSSASRRRRRRPRCKATEAATPTPTPRPTAIRATVPPVMGVINILVGLRFYPTAHMAVSWEIGFRDAMFFGIGVHYLF